MSSADMCRVALPSRISRIFRRGSVTFKPALRRSLPSTRTLRRTAAASAAGDPRSGMIAGMIILHRAQLRLALRAFTALLLASALSACVYRMNIQQGNYLEGKTVDQLQVGMTRSQVRYLLGTPLVPAVFDKDRWDYVYYFKHGRLRRRSRGSRRSGRYSSMRSPSAHTSVRARGSPKIPMAAESHGIGAAGSAAARAAASASAMLACSGSSTLHRY